MKANGPPISLSAIKIFSDRRYAATGTINKRYLLIVMSGSGEAKSCLVF